MTAAGRRAPREEPAAAAVAATPGDDLDELFRERARDIAVTLRGRTSDREAVWDAVQEAFARFAALSPARRQRIGRPDAYLFRTGVNLLKDWGRAAARTASLSEEPALSEPRPDPTCVLESRDRLRRLEAAMLRLRPRTREIFLAHRLDGLSYAEIAERTGLSVKGVEKQMSKAIAMIDRLAGDR